MENPAPTLSTPPSSTTSILAEDVRLLKMLGAGLWSRYATAKNESTILSSLQNIPGSSVPSNILRIAESGATKLARMVFNLSIVQWGFNTIDKITSRELILLLTKAAENLEQQQNDLNSSDLSLVRHLHSFLKDVATTNGTFKTDPEKARQLESILSSPGSKKQEWLLKEDSLRAQLKMLSIELQSVQKQLVTALSSEATMERNLLDIQEKNKLINDELVSKNQLLKNTILNHNIQDNEKTSLLNKEKTIVKSLEIQLAASNVKCNELCEQLQEANNNTKKVTESVGTLMEQLKQKTKEVRNYEKLKNDHDISKNQLIELQNEISNGMKLNSNLMNELKKTEQQLIDVQSFMKSDNGSKLKQTELALAQARLELAQTQSENDDLQEEISDLKQIIQSNENFYKQKGQQRIVNKNEWKSSSSTTLNNKTNVHWG